MPGLMLSDELWSKLRDIMLQHRIYAKAAPNSILKLPESAYVITDKGYDSEAIREQIREKDAIPNIPRKQHSKTGHVSGR